MGFCRRTRIFVRSWKHHGITFIGPIHATNISASSGDKITAKTAMKALGVRLSFQALDGGRVHLTLEDAKRIGGRDRYPRDRKKPRLAVVGAA